MKHIIFLSIAILVFNFSAPAQLNEFAPVGARWWITEYNANEAPPAYYIFEVEKDTSIETVIYKKLIRTRIQVAYSPDTTVKTMFYFHEDSGKIVVWDEIENHPEPYFDFTAEIGDTIATTVYFGPADTAQDKYLYSVVTGVSDTLISGQILKKISTEYLPYNYSEDLFVVHFSDLFIEEMGGTGYPIPWIMSGLYDGEFPGPVKCYEDSLLSLIKFIAEDCDYLETGINENVFNGFIQIYPNPAFDKIYFRLNSIENVAVEAYDINGVRINFTPQARAANLFESDISNLPAGIYFVRFIQNNQTITTQKFIRN